jgi:DNA-binding NarL/FixJ family response regulator
MALTDYPQAWLPVHRTFRGDHERLLVHGGPLFDALSEYFEMQWERAVPLHVAGGHEEPANADVPTDIDRTLIRLLAAGLTEEAIADHLGWHRRTTQHHLRAMMAKLDANTRYQAGYQAVRRGWVTCDAV